MLSLFLILFALIIVGAAWQAWAPAPQPWKNLGLLLIALVAVLVLLNAAGVL